jgi:hypothetical protein
VKSETWTDRNTGEPRTGLVVLVDSWSPIGGQSIPAGTASPAAKAAAPAAPAWDSGADLTDEIPF